jgi:hypothetical protein
MNPAPVSGPGALSERTDGGAIDGMTQPAQRYAGFGYGENLALEEQQAGASMAGTPNVPFANVVALDAPTQRPDEPLTAGAPFGPGFTPEEQVTGRYKLVSKYLPMLNEQASNPDAPDTFKNFVKYVNAANELDGII